MLETDHEITELTRRLEAVYKRVRIMPPSGEREAARATMLRQVRAALEAKNAEPREFLAARIRHDIAELEASL